MPLYNLVFLKAKNSHLFLKKLQRDAAPAPAVPRSTLSCASHIPLYGAVLVIRSWEQILCRSFKIINVFNPSRQGHHNYALRITNYALKRADIIRPVNYLFFLRTRTATTSGPILEATAAPIEPNISAFLPVRFISSFSTSFARVLSRP